VDVRTVPEYEQVGHVPGTPLVVWPRDGGAEDYNAFVEQIRDKFETGEPLLLLCRSGARSHYAAHLLTQAGFKRAYNVLEGFEGAQPGQGWRAAGLPSTQG
jgi:rhodanese-related sulfurtransferase